MWLKLHTDPVGWADDAQREALQASGAFQSLGDERGLARAWSLLGGVHMMRAELASAESAWERAAEHADRAGDRREEMESRASVPLAIWSGPSHVDACLLRCEHCIQRARGDKKALSSALMAKAVVVAGLGRFEEARALIAQARALLEEVALPVWSAGPLAQLAGWVELLAGAPVAAERELRRGFETLSEIGELAWLSTTVALLAEAVYEQGRYEEAEQLANTSQASAAPEDAYSQVAWRSVRAKVLARHRMPEEAEALARECVSLVEETDFLPLRWRASMTCGEVFTLIGRPDEAMASFRQAVAVAEQKGDVAAARQARDLMRAVEEEARASGS
jgi:tetratricopeptide (TPR) repeat protein